MATGHNQYRNTWKHEEILIILKFYEIYGGKYCQLKLNRTKGQIDNKAHMMDLKARNALAPGEREALYMYLHGYDTKQAARLLGLTVNAYEKRRIRGARHLDYHITKLKNDKTLLQEILLPHEIQAIRNRIKEENL